MGTTISTCRTRVLPQPTKSHLYLHHSQSRKKLFVGLATLHNLTLQGKRTGQDLDVPGAKVAKGCPNLDDR
jgi:hypothetical protein